MQQPNNLELERVMRQLNPAQRPKVAPNDRGLESTTSTFESDFIQAGDVSSLLADIRAQGFLRMEAA